MDAIADIHGLQFVHEQANGVCRLLLIHRTLDVLVINFQCIFPPLFNWHLNNVLNTILVVIGCESYATDP